MAAHEKTQNQRVRIEILKLLPVVMHNLENINHITRRVHVVPKVSVQPGDTQLR